MNKIHPSFSRSHKPANEFIGRNYRPNRRYRLEQIISLSNRASPYQTQFNAARRLLAV